jgi:NADPH-dependent 2,4-dienoyl-CoA reductase/sulfur reductase-like enzyme/rhodanese-related sulfurtransferase
MKSDMSTADNLKVVIVGGKAAGPKAAAVLKRRMPDAEITLFQREEYDSYSSCGLPLFASGDISSFEQLTLTPYGTPKNPEFYSNTKGFKFVTGAEVTKIDRQDKTVGVTILRNGEKYNRAYDKLVLATGSIPNRPSFPVAESPRIRHFTRPEDAFHFRELTQKGKISRAVIIGGGYIGCELTEAVAGMWGIETTIIEKENQILPCVLDREMALIAERELSRHHVRLLTDAIVTRIGTGSDGSPTVGLEGGEKIKTDYVFLCLGVRPNVSLAEDCGLRIGVTGGIEVDHYMCTSDPDIYAGGDCVESSSRITGNKLYIPMGSLANRHGRIIAENIAGNNLKFAGVTGAFMLKIYDINVGAVGTSRQQAEKENLKPGVVWGTFVDKPDYHPESKRLHLKLIYSENDNRLLGLQGVGFGDICRRIDVFSAFLQREATIDDLTQFEHGYAPSYADVIDPLHEMGTIAGAQQRGISFINPTEMPADSVFWLDVREYREAADSPWPVQDEPNEKRYLNIPMNDLRANIGKLDKSRKTIIICGRGSRSYQAALILRDSGFRDVHVLGGGTLAALS